MICILFPFLTYAQTTSIKERITYIYGQRFAKIVECESNFRNYDRQGNVLKSVTNDYGIFQINYIWEPIANINGFSLKTMTEEQGLIMVNIIMTRQSIQAWSCNKLV